MQNLESFISIDIDSLVVLFQRNADKTLKIADHCQFEYQFYSIPFILAYTYTISQIFMKNIKILFLLSIQFYIVFQTKINTYY